MNPLLKEYIKTLQNYIKWLKTKPSKIDIAHSVYERQIASLEQQIQEEETHIDSYFDKKPTERLLGVLPQEETITEKCTCKKSEFSRMVDDFVADVVNQYKK